MAQFIIGIIIVVLGVILTTVGGYFAKDGWDKMYRKDINKKSVAIQQLSESNLKDIVTRLAEQLKPQLAKQYSGSHTVFGVYQDGFVVPKGQMPENLEIEWNTAKVQSTNNNMLEVTLPDMILNGKLFVGGNKTTIAKRIGAKSAPIIKVGWFNPILEVIGIHDELVVIALGFPVDDSKK